MKVHEYQAKQLLGQRGLPVPLGRVAMTVAEATAAVRPLIEESGNPVVVVKAQIHAGGRGKGRFKEHPDVAGVNVVVEGIDGGPEAAELKVRELSDQMLGSTLVTVQTGPEGRVVGRLYLEQGVDIARELYLSVLLNRSSSRNILMASIEGGTEIEEVAAQMPEKIFKVEIDPAFGLLDYQARSLGYRLGFEGEVLRNGAAFFKRLAEAAVDLDADLLEINPLVVTGGGEVIALDAKMSFESNALFRHPDIAGMRDVSEEDAAEVEADGPRSELHQARRNDRLHGQRCRPGNGHDGHHQVRRRRAGQLSRRRGRGGTGTRSLRRSRSSRGIRTYAGSS